MCLRELDRGAAAEAIDWANEDSVHSPGEQLAYALPLNLGIVTGAQQKHAQVGLAQRGLEARGKRRKERRNDFWHDQSHCSRPTIPQSPCDWVELIAQLLCRIADLLDDIFSNPTSAGSANHARDRSDREARLPRDIRHRHSPPSHSAIPQCVGHRHSTGHTRGEKRDYVDVAKKRAPASYRRRRPSTAGIRDLATNHRGRFFVPRAVALASPRAPWYSGGQSITERCCLVQQGCLGTQNSRGRHRDDQPADQ